TSYMLPDSPPADQILAHRGPRRYSARSPSGYSLLQFGRKLFSCNPRWNRRSYWQALALEYSEAHRTISLKREICGWVSIPRTLEISARSITDDSATCSVSPRTPPSRHYPPAALRS